GECRLHGLYLGEIGDGFAGLASPVVENLETVIVKCLRVDDLTPSVFVDTLIEMCSIDAIIDLRLRIPLSYLKMQVRTASNPIAADISDDLTRAHLLIRLKRQQGIHMTVSRIECLAVCIMLDHNHMT